ncbi:MAG TPA: hypothetical protein VGM29_04775, partial [Polyangiaceae bacterium]
MRCSATRSARSRRAIVNSFKTCDVRAGSRSDGGGAEAVAARSTGAAGGRSSLLGDGTVGIGRDGGGASLRLASSVDVGSGPTFALSIIATDGTGVALAGRGGLGARGTPLGGAPGSVGAARLSVESGPCGRMLGGVGRMLGGGGRMLGGGGRVAET